MNMEAKPVSSNARIAFRCEKCAECCQNLADPFMLDALDAYALQSICGSTAKASRARTTF